MERAVGEKDSLISEVRREDLNPGIEQRDELIISAYCRFEERRLKCFDKSLKSINLTSILTSLPQSYLM